MGLYWIFGPDKDILSVKLNVPFWQTVAILSKKAAATPNNSCRRYDQITELFGHTKFNFCWF